MAAERYIFEIRGKRAVLTERGWRTSDPKLRAHLNRLYSPERFADIAISRTAHAAYEVYYSPLGAKLIYPEKLPGDVVAE
jgi:hypothetical protein